MAVEEAEIPEVAVTADVAEVVKVDLDLAWPKIVVPLQDEPCLAPLHWCAAAWVDVPLQAKPCLVLLHWSAVALVDVPLQAEPRLAPSPAVAMAAILGLGGSLHAVGK